jgi:hypothetical protein
VGDGTIEWNVPVSFDEIKTLAEFTDNIAPADKGVGIADPSRPAVIVLRFPSSYVYVKAQAIVEMTRIPPQGSIRVSFSDNNGLDWKDVTTLQQGGGHTIDLTPLVQRRYDYRLKLELMDKGTTLTALRMANQFQCSQAALPAIAEGENHLTFTAGANEGTVTIEGCTDFDAAKKNQQLTIADFHPALSGGMSPKLQMTAPSGDATFDVVTPGDMTRLRISAVWRAKEAGDGFDVQVSYDGGSTFKTVPNGTLEGNTRGQSRYLIVDDVPPGTRKAQVRLAGRQTGTAFIFDLRIDADYQQPAGGFKPVKITYVWDEAGKLKSDVHIAKTPTDQYSITCGPGTVVRSYTLELAE